MPKHILQPTVPEGAVKAVKLGGNSAGTRFTDADVGKLVKLTGDSRYDLCAAGNPIEGVASSVESGLSEGYVVGGVQDQGRIWATADGLQATPGTGVIAVGDYVVTGTVVALQTALANGGYARVTKATDQAVASAHPFAWRVMSLGMVGTGAVGTDIVIERM